MKFSKQFSAQQKKQYAQRKKEEYQKLEDNMLKKTTEVTNDPQKVLEYLDFMGKFYNYSSHNRAMIYSQREGAEAVGSYKFFKDEGFHVNKGEQGIKIIVPQKVTLFERQLSGKTQIVKLSQATESEKRNIKEGKIKTFGKTRYGLGTVFDVTQTNMPKEKYPEYYPNRHEDYQVTDPEKAKQLDYALKKHVAPELGVEIVDQQPPIDFEKPDQNKRAEGETLGKLLKPEQTPSLSDQAQKAFYKELPNKQLGYYYAQLKLQQENMKKESGQEDKIKQYDKSIKMIEGEATLRQLGNAKGMYVPKQDKIYLNPKNTPTENVSVLIHELGHSILHGKKTPQKEQYAKENKIENAFKNDYSTPIKELQAELTSYTVSKQFGIDKQDSAARYIAGWTNKGQKLHDLKPTDQNKILETVTNVATAFDKTIQKSMNKVTQKTQKIQQNMTQNRVQTNVQKPQAVPKR